MDQPRRLGLLTISWLAFACTDDTTDPATTDSDASSTGDAADSTTGGLPDPTTAMPSTTTTPDDTTSGVDPDTSTGVDSDTSTGAGPTCGDGIIDGDEVCDGADLGSETCASQGFSNGPLGCLGDCAGFDTSACGNASCGNGVQDAGEDCDGPDLGGADCGSLGFDNGSLACAFDCTLNTSGCGTCGNIIVEGTDEVCDTIVFLGQTCVTQGYDSGQIGCAADCQSYELSGCGTCGNDLIDGAELCDGLDNGGETCLSLGFDSGTLGACMPSCSAFDTSACGTCGNNVTDGDEFCDGTDVNGQTCVTQGFDSGPLGCAGDCGAYDPSSCGTCGNGIVDGAESCDGANLGGETCASLGLLGGTLGCSASCQYDFASCDIPGIPFGSDPGYSGYALTPPVTSCDDISATGTPTGLTDDSNQVVPIGFSFPLYGVPYADANIQSNGVLRFGDMSYLSFANGCLPSATAPSTNNLYVFWDDLNPSLGAGEIYYQTLGPVGDQRFVVQWDTANYGGDTLDLMRFQVVLHQATGQIDVCYVDTINAANTANSGAEATAGIQQNAATGLQYSCNTPSLTNGLQLLYIPM
jgi:hypothetical protein